MTGPSSAARAPAAQARRLAAHRTALLGSGAYTFAELSRLRAEDEDRTRLWLARQLGDRTLLTVTHDRQQLIPAFQLTTAGEPRPELQPLLEVLADADIGGWTTWTWLTQPSGLLSNQRPVDVAVTDLPRARRAAERFAWTAPGA